MRRRVVTELRQDHMQSDHKVARACDCSGPFVAKVRRQLEADGWFRVPSSTGAKQREHLVQAAARTITAIAEARGTDTVRVMLL
jgi:hypothetical protein